MIWIVIIVVIVLIVIATFNKKDEALKYQVDSFGGMAKKYELLISELTKHEQTKVTKATRDTVVILWDGNSTKMNFIITEIYNKVQIDWVGNFNIYGTQKHQWTYPHTYPQDKIYSEISEFLEIKMKEVFG